MHGVVACYLGLIDADLVVAIACSYRPKGHPGQPAERLAQLARKR